jgi:molybdate transport system ATP-binding protein
MDEPLSALDVKRKQEILPYLDRLHDELDIPLLYVSHAPDEVARLADHLVAMESGHVVASGPLTETLAQLDLPIRLGEDVGCVLEADVGAIDEGWHLARLDFAGGALWTRDRGLPIGHRVRLRVLARDVSLAREQPMRTSIQNLLKGRVDAIADDEHPGLALVRVRVGGASLLARVTMRAAHDLDLSSGQEVWVQVKSVALMQ